MLEDTEQYHKDRFLDRLCFYLQMGRSIPSFRQLLEIEKLKITSFKKMLPTKKDKQEFDEIFDNVRLYTSYMGNASNPIPLESILMGAILHNYKQLLQLSNSKVNGDPLKEELVSLLNNKHKGKIHYYNLIFSFLTYIRTKTSIYYLKVIDSTKQYK